MLLAITPGLDASHEQEGDSSPSCESGGDQASERVKFVDVVDQVGCQVRDYAGGCTVHAAHKELFGIPAHTWMPFCESLRSRQADSVDLRGNTCSSDYDFTMLVYLIGQLYFLRRISMADTGMNAWTDEQLEKFTSLCQQKGIQRVNVSFNKLSEAQLAILQEGNSIHWTCATSDSEMNHTTF